MISESLTGSWRPDKSVPVRFVRALKATSSEMKSPWLFEQMSFFFSGELLAETAGGILSHQQRKVVADAFYEMMYFNRCLDEDFSRTKGRREGALFLEDWYCLPQRIAEVKTRAKQVGLNWGNSLEDWFFVNRFINTVFLRSPNSVDLEVTWKTYGEDGGKENQIVEGLRSMYEQTNGDPIKLAILFRVTSSVGFGKCLVGLCNGHGSDKTTQYGRVKRVGAMVMSTQMMDDFATASKDVKKGISGIALASYDNDYSLKGNGIKVGINGAKKALGVSRQVVSACVEAIGFEAKKPYKRKIASVGITLVSALASLAMFHKHGGTNYPFWSSVVELAEITGKSARGIKQDSDYKNYTLKTLNEVLDLLLTETT